MTGRSEYWGKLDIMNQPSMVRQIWFSRNDELPELPTVDEPPQEPDTLDHVATRDLLKKIIEKTPLTLREEIVIIRRFVYGDTLDEAASKIGVTQERCRQIEIKALRKLKHRGRLFGEEFGEGGSWGRVTTWREWVIENKLLIEAKKARELAEEQRKRRNEQLLQEWFKQG